MDIKVIAVDLDGTLLNSRKEISILTKKMFNELHRKGVRIVISSGRTLEAIKKYERELGFKCWISAMNGALVVRDSGEVIKNIIFEKKDLSGILRYLGKLDVFYNLSSIDVLYCRDGVLRKKREYGVNTCYMMHDNIINLDNLKINRIIVETEDLEVLEHISNYLKKNYKIEITKSEKRNIEIMPETANKGNSLELICNHLKIPRENTLVFGDGQNDISMFERAGIRVAMGNATEVLKKCADYITSSNDQEGICLALRHLIT